MGIIIRVPLKLIIELITEDGPDFRESDAKADIVRCCIKDSSIDEMRKEILAYYGLSTFTELKKENPLVVSILSHYFGVILWS